LTERYFLSGRIDVSFLYAGVSIKNMRPTNMDCILLDSGHLEDKKVLLSAVCDGVGSLADGAYASGMAIRLMSGWFNSISSVNRIGLVFRDAVLEINNHIVIESRRNNLETASTLSALLLVEDRFYIVHIGDSRIYSYENETLSILTNDDVSESGKLTACIGKSDGIFLQYSEGLATGKTFLVCSDGLYKRIDNSYMMAALRSWDKKSVDEPLGAMTQYVVNRGETDNISVALVRMER
jgi:protein phosphatase